MDWLEIVQTVAICINSILLFAITYMVFMVGSSFLPPTQKELEEMLAEDDYTFNDEDESEDESYVILTNLDPQEAKELLDNAPSGRRRGSKRRRRRK